MTRQKDCNAIQEVVELLAHDGFDSLGEAIRRIINEGPAHCLDTFRAPAPHLS